MSRNTDRAPKQRPISTARYSYGGGTSTFPPAPPSESNGRPGPQFGEASHDDDDNDEDDGDNGFGSYSDFKQVRPASNRYSFVPLAPSTPAPLHHTTNPRLSKTDWELGEARREPRVDPDKLTKGEWAASQLGAAGRGVGGWWGRHWKAFMVTLLGIMVVLAITLYFVVPRDPVIAFGSSTPLSSSDMNATTSASPPSFRFNGNVLLSIDASSNYLPLHFSSLKIFVSLSSTGGIIGNATNVDFTVPGKQLTAFLLPTVFSGTYNNISDPTYTAIRASCTHIYNTETRPSISLTLDAQYSIMGMIGSRSASSRVVDVVCPVQFSASAP